MRRTITYTGIDLAEKLLEKGKKLVSKTDYEVHLIHKDVYDYHAGERRALRMWPSE